MKQAAKLLSMMQAAEKGGSALKKLNFALGFVIPFNKPHKFKVQEIGPDFVRTIAPYRRKNFNHIRGIHACGIATISEFATGLLLLRKIDASKYRIIMSEMRMEYHYQAKKDLIAEARISDEELQSNFIAPLEKEGTISRTVIAKVHDIDENHVATAHITWQLKAGNRSRPRYKVRLLKVLPEASVK